MSMSIGTHSDNIFLIGFMGTGKSTIAEKLNTYLHLDVLEMDAILEQQEGRSISEIFAAQGEPYFRSLETALLQKIQTCSGKIVSCGGGVVMQEQNVKMMRQSGVTVLLTAAPETVWMRLAGDDSRPLLHGCSTVEEIAERMRAREAAYQSAADFTVCTDHRSADVITREILGQLKERGFSGEEKTDR